MHAFERRTDRRTDGQTDRQTDVDSKTVRMLRSRTVTSYERADEVWLIYFGIEAGNTTLTFDL